MNFTINGLEPIEDNQELYDYHYSIVEQFKNEYKYAFCYEFSKASMVDVVFNYDWQTSKFEFVSINKLDFVHNRIVSVYPKVRKWF